MGKFTTKRHQRKSKGPLTEWSESYHASPYGSRSKSPHESGRFEKAIPELQMSVVLKGHLGFIFQEQGKKKRSVKTTREIHAFSKFQFQHSS